MPFERYAESGAGKAAPSSEPAFRLDRGPETTEIWDTLRTIIDPEIGLDIVTLGLVYGLECDGPSVRVRFTLTTRACPLGEVIRAGIEGALANLPGIEHVETDLVWEPAWHPGRIGEEY